MESTPGRRSGFGPSLGNVTWAAELSTGFRIRVNYRSATPLGARSTADSGNGAFLMAAAGMVRFIERR